MQAHDVQQLLCAPSSDVPLQGAAVLRARHLQRVKRQDRIHQRDPLHAWLLGITRVRDKRQHRAGALTHTHQQHRPRRIRPLQFTHDSGEVVGVLRVVPDASACTRRPSVPAEVEEQNVHAGHAS